MDRLERFKSPEESLIKALSGWQSGVWTALPGYVEAFDPIKQVLSIQPTIKAKYQNPETKEQSWIQLPLLVDVILVNAGGGGMTLTNPIAKGDEALVVFSSRCIDAWWQSSGVQNQTELRMHDLSDGFAIVGLRSLPRVLSNYSTTEMQLRSDDENVVIGINPTNHNISIKAVKMIIASDVEITGDVKITGNTDTTGTLKNNSHDVGSSHQHLNSGGTGLGGVPQ